MSKKLLLAALAGASIAGLSAGAAFADPGPAAAKAKAPPAASAADLEALRAEVEALKARLDQQSNANAQQAQQLQQTQAQLSQTQAQLSTAKASADQAVTTARASQQQVQQQAAQIPAQVSSALAAAKPKDDGKLHYKGVTITLGGFSELAGIYRDHDETADISSSFSKIPFPNDRAGHTSSFGLTARQSRYSALVQGDVTDKVHLGFYGEFDFQGAAQTANSNQSDSYNPRIRQLYGEANWDTFGLHLLAGQNWSLVTMNSQGITPRNEVPPPAIDAQYVPGFAWARQPQIRLTKDFDKKFWLSISAENSQTTFGSTAVASGVTATNSQAPTNGFFNATNYSLNRYPDVVGKVAYDDNLDGHIVHVEALGLLRNFYDRVTINPAAGTQAATIGLIGGTGTDSTSAGGYGGGISLGVVPKVLDVEASVLTGNGIGRYGSGGLSDVTLRPDGSVQALPETMWLAGVTWHATPALDLYVFGGQEQERSKTFPIAALPTAAFGYGAGLPGTNNAGCLTEGGSCSALNKSINQVTVGLWDKVYNGPFGNFRVGLQYSHSEREAFADANGIAPKGVENMVFTSIRFYPF